MDDIVESSPDPNQGRRWAGLLVVALLFGGVAGDAAFDDTSSRARPDAASEAAGGSGSPTQPPSVPAGLPTLSLAEGGGPHDLEVVVGGSHPVTVDAAAGTVHPVAGLDLGGDEYVELMPVGDALVALIPSAVSGRGEVYVVDDGSARLLYSGANEVLPMADGGVLALTRSGTVEGGELTALNLDGTARWSRPNTARVLADTPQGLVTLEVAEIAGGTLRLVDPATGAVRRTIAEVRHVVASDDRQVAWMPATAACPWPGSATEVGDCELVVTNLRTLAERRFELTGGEPSRRHPAFGAFTPDGSVLALSYPGLHEPGAPGIDPSGFVAVLDLRTGALDRLPGLSTPAKDAAGLAWSSDGRSLVVSVRWPHHVRLALWQPTRAHAVALPPTIPNRAPSAPTVAVI